MKDNLERITLRRLDGKIIVVGNVGETLKRLVKRKKYHMFNVDLPNIDLSESDLSKSDFRGANLCGSNFNMSNLCYANFRMANLSGVNFSGSDLSGVDFSDANLSGADLSYASFDYNSTLMGSDLRGAKLVGTNLIWCDLRKADLRGADMRWVTLGEKRLDYCDVTGVRWSDPVPWPIGEMTLGCWKVSVKLNSTVIFDSVNRRVFQNDDLLNAVPNDELIKSIHYSNGPVWWATYGSIVKTAINCEKNRIKNEEREFRECENDL